MGVLSQAADHLMLFTFKLIKSFPPDVVSFEFDWDSWKQEHVFRVACNSVIIVQGKAYTSFCSCVSLKQREK